MKEYKLVYFIALTIAFAACESDFLEKNPLDVVSSQIFWKDQSDAYLGLIGVYSRLQQTYYDYQRVHLDCLTDNARAFDKSSACAIIQSITYGDILPTTGGMASSMYYGGYKGISACNIFLENIKDVEMDDELKNQYIAEVRFIRAWFYFNLQQFYGDVIIYETPPTVENSKIKQSLGTDVINFILQDLDEAIPALPNESYTGRVVKNSALALKTKVLLFSKRWAEAATTASDVMSSGTTFLSDNYTALFLTKGQESNPKEVLFSTRYLYPDNTSKYQILVAWDCEPTPRQELVNDYECIDGLSINVSPLYDPEEPYSNRDPRLIQSIQVEPWVLPNGQIAQQYSVTGFYIQKGIDKEIGPIGYETQSDNDIIHLRYADVLLMYAEAKNETSGPDQSVYDAINTVRGRSNMPAIAEGLSKEYMREKIRHERRIELTFEGHRYFDIKRWEIAPQVMAAVNEPGKGIGALKFKSHQYAWPFPQEEIDLNPELDQKTGY